MSHFREKSLILGIFLGISSRMSASLQLFGKYVTVKSVINHIRDQTPYEVKNLSCIDDAKAGRIGEILAKKGFFNLLSTFFR